MNALATTAAPLNYGDLEKLADSIAKSGLFGIKTKDQAIALMMIAHAEGAHPALAARDYDVIQGRPAKKAEAMMRDFLQAGGKVEWHALTDDEADATFTHPQTGSVRIDWNIERARIAGVAGKDNWKKFPRAMLRSRVVSEGIRTLWPLATSGMYVPEEVADLARKDEHNGPTIEHTSERQAINDATPMQAAAAATPRPPRKVEQPAKPITDYTEEQLRAWAEKLRAACAVLYSKQEVVEVGNRKSVGDMISNGPEWLQREIASILSEAYARFPAEDAEPTVDDDPFAPGLEIVGEAKLAAG